MKKYVLPIDLAAQTDIATEVIVNIKELSRRSASKSIDSSLYKILNFDILCCERDWERTTRVFDQLKSSFQAVRVQDPGILSYVIENSELPVELVLENGHHNWQSVARWVKFVGKRLKKVVLSYELPKNRIAEYAQKLSELGIESEMFLVGDILLFYSPRMLLDHQIKTQSDEIKLFADSEESPHKGFEVEQNVHGTFMYHLKKLFLLDRINEIEEMELTHLRVEIVSNGMGEFLTDSSKRDLNGVVADFPYSRTRGYFDINKSDVLFPKLKNEELEKNRDDILGEVVSAKKSVFTAIRLKKNLNKLENQKLYFVTGEGKRIETELKTLKNVNGEEISEAFGGSLVIINHVKKATPKTVLFLN